MVQSTVIPKSPFAGLVSWSQFFAETLKAIFMLSPNYNLSDLLVTGLMSKGQRTT